MASRDLAKLYKPFSFLYSKHRTAAIICCRNFHGPPKEQEYNEIAQYPPINQGKTRDEREQMNLVDLVKNMKTVEEKLFHLNKPKYYGWYTAVADAKKVPYGTLEFVQFATNTTLVENCLPDKYGNVIMTENATSSETSIDAEAKKLAKEIKPVLKAFLVNSSKHFESYRDVETDKIAYHEIGAKKTEEQGYKVLKREKVQRVINGINRIILAHLAPVKSHLMDTTVDYLPRTEAFWFRGGFLPNKRMITKRLGRYEADKKNKVDPEFAFKKERVYEEHDRAIQAIGDSILQLRCDKMVAPFIENYKEDEICQRGPVPKWNYDPSYTGFFSRHRFGTNLPGHWTPSPSRFTHLSFVNACNDKEMKTNESSWSPDSEYNSRPEMLLAKAILSSFAVLLPDACYQGFSPLYDPTQPFTTQTIVSDGRNFKFTVCQLNKTALLDVDSDERTTTRNVCWHLPEKELYSSIDENEVQGFNIDVLETLIKFYILEPTVNEEDIDNKDCLGPAKYIHNLKNNYNREFFSSNYNFICSNRPRAIPRPDILAYQRIFMINHPEQMFMVGNREQPWFRMAELDYCGKENWHPEFKSLDSFKSRTVKKFRKNKWDIYRKKVLPPLPEDAPDV